MALIVLDDYKTAYLEFPQWKARWANFTPFELRCRGTNKLLIDPDELDKLQALRSHVAFPFLITSAGRAPEYNATLNKGKGGGPAHPLACAWDQLIYGHRAFRLIATARSYGFTGIGVKQHGPRGKRFVHLDTLLDHPTAPRPWVWSYK